MGNLEQKLRMLIAEAHGILPEDVTPEFVEAQRHALYARPSHRFMEDNPSLRVQTTAEIEAERLIAEAFLAQSDIPE